MIFLFHSEHEWLCKHEGKWVWSDYLEDAFPFPDLPTALAVCDLLKIDKIRALQQIN